MNTRTGRIDRIDLDGEFDETCVPLMRKNTKEYEIVFKAHTILFSKGTINTNNFAVSARWMRELPEVQEPAFKAWIAKCQKWLDEEAAEWKKLGW